MQQSLGEKLDKVKIVHSQPPNLLLLEQGSKGHYSYTSHISRSRYLKQCIYLVKLSRVVYPFESSG